MLLKVHVPFHQAPDAQNGVHRTPGPAESELLAVQVGSHLFQVPDESARDDTLQQFGLLVQIGR